MNAHKHRSRQFGVSLIELMVAMVIGLFLILGAVTVFSQSRSTYRTAESVARLQEIGRLAMDVVETDVRMANFWGMSNRADYIVNRAPIGQTPPAEWLGTNAAVCGDAGANNYFVVNLDEYIGGSNNSYSLNSASPECDPASDYLDGSDTLWIRRANSTPPVAMETDRIYLQTSRIQGTLFVPGCTNPTNQLCIPADYLPPASMSRALESHIYYVSSTSTNRNDVPSLRRKRFASVNGADAFIDEEIVPGVEDLQVRFGVDTDGDTNIDQYVNPGAVPANADVVSATIWLRIRAEERENGLVDDTTYGYADITPVTPNDNFRRVLLTKTIHIRNTRS